jgi:hypothetical protein
LPGAIQTFICPSEEGRGGKKREEKGREAKSVRNSILAPTQRRFTMKKWFERKSGVDAE